MTSTTVSQPIAAPRAWKKIAFYTVTTLFVGLLVVFTGILVSILPYLVTGWAISPTETIHHLHEFLTSAFFWSLLIGAGAQFFNPRQRSARLLRWWSSSPWPWFRFSSSRPISWACKVCTSTSTANFSTGRRRPPSLWPWSSLVQSPPCATAAGKSPLCRPA